MIRRVRDGGRVVFGPGITDATPGGRLGLTAPERLEFSFAPLNEVKDQPLRLRYKLEGVDPDWREAGGEMQVLVICHGGANEILSCRSYRMVGESAGWSATVGDSVFHQRRETLALPPETERLEVLLTVQDWEVLGTAAITDFRISRQDASGREENLWPDPRIEEGRNLDSPEGEPRHWTRGRFGASMAQVVELPPPAQGHALVIADTGTHISPSWQAELPLEGRARDGETLTLEWREAFSVGTGGGSHAHYDPLAPGEYVFRVRTVTPSGEPIGGEVALPVSIAPVFWKRPAVVPLSLAALALAVLFTAGTWKQRRMQAQLGRAERHRRVERERLRIAQDIHDDLGASLTQISLLSQTAHKRMERSHPAWPETERLRSVTLNLTQKLDEIVWAVSPRHDTLESLVSYLTDLAGDFLGAAGIRIRIHVPDELPGWVLPPELRHGVFLAAKESLNNVVKHAQATEVHLRLAILPGAFQLTIEDNGRGVSAPLPHSPPDATCPVHHGLEGIQRRIESLGGSCAIRPTNGRGTSVILRVPVDGGES